MGLLGTKEYLTHDALIERIFQEYRECDKKKALLETLGYCSILETNEHKGFLKKYTNLASAPRKTHSSDWNYPVDFWLGKDGINKDAFKFWFGEYKELEQFWR